MPRACSASEVLQGPDPVVDVQAGDIFYSADHSPHAVMEAAKTGLYAGWRARGVSINFLVHDLLPVLRPEFFPPHADLTHAAWLDCMAADLRPPDLRFARGARRPGRLAGTAQRSRTHRCRNAAPVLHHGADIGADLAAGGRRRRAVAGGQQSRRPPQLPDGRHHRAAQGPPAGAGRLRAAVGRGRGREPGHRRPRRLDAAAGCGSPHHSAHHGAPARQPGAGRRLLWLHGIDDDTLQQVYLASACLLFSRAKAKASACR
jgi:hypothetical protein